MDSAVMFSRKTDEWETPQALFDELNAEFRFQWDAAATRDTGKCGPFTYFGPDHVIGEWRDALAGSWVCLPDSDTRRFWLNPPYSQCRAFIAKAAEEAQKGATVVCLVPSRTDTRWWHDHVWDRDRHQPRPGVEVRFLKGRLKFSGASCGDYLQVPNEQV